MDAKQQEKVDQFKGLTGLTGDAQCVAILEAHGWDIQAAVHSVLGDSPSARTERSRPHRRSAGLNRHDEDEVREDTRLLASTENTLRSSSARHQPPNCCERCWTFLNGLFRRAPVAEDEKQRSPTEKFRYQFEQKYGPIHPEFFNGAFSLALSTAVRNGKILFVYLHSSDHDDTDKFCRECFVKTENINFLNNHCLCFCVNVKDYEGFRLSKWLKVESYPFSCMISKVQSQVMIRGRQDGYVNSETFHRVLLQAQQEFDEVAASAQNSENHVSAAEIVEEQNREYEEALARDKARLVEEEEKRLKLLEEQKQREFEEMKRQEVIQMQQQLLARKAEERQRRLDTLPPEPPLGKGTALLQFRLPDGKSIRRRFNAVDSMEVVCQFVMGHELLDVEGNEIQQWELMMNYPRKTFPSDIKQTISEAGIPDQSVLYVREVL